MINKRDRMRQDATLQPLCQYQNILIYGNNLKSVCPCRYRVYYTLAVHSVIVGLYAEFWSPGRSTPIPLHQNKSQGSLHLLAFSRDFIGRADVIFYLFEKGLALFYWRGACLLSVGVADCNI